MPRVGSEWYGGPPSTSLELEMINNAHPRDDLVLYTASKKLLPHIVEMFEVCLESWCWPLIHAKRVKFDCYEWWETFDQWKEKLAAEKEETRAAKKQHGMSPASDESHEDEDDEDDLYEQYMDERTLSNPPNIVPNFSGRAPRDSESRLKLRGRDLKIITKVASIELTPEKNRYPGGAWHLEGTAKEAIVATAICYLSAENITESRLAFRRACEQYGIDYEQDDQAGVESVYGLDLRGHRETIITESAGSVVAAQGKTVVFPNSMQHCVEPFALADPTRPGRRTILAYFLVDPFPKSEEEAQLHLTTAQIPPQQRLWLERTLSSTPALKCLPSELISKIASKADFTFDDQEAKRRRELLMDERYSYNSVTTSNHFEVDFSLCEH